MLDVREKQVYLFITVPCCHSESWEVCDVDVLLTSPISTKFVQFVQNVFEIYDSDVSAADCTSHTFHCEHSLCVSALKQWVFSTRLCDLTHLTWLPLKGNFQELLFAPLFSLSLEQRVTCSWSQKLFSEARGLSSPGVMWNLAQQQFLEPFNLPNPKQRQHQKMKFLKSW